MRKQNQQTKTPWNENTKPQKTPASSREKTPSPAHKITSPHQHHHTRHQQQHQTRSHCLMAPYLSKQQKYQGQQFSSVQPEMNRSTLPNNNDG